MMVSVPLTLPGLVNSINPKIHAGVGTRLFDIAYILEVSAYYSPFSPLNLMWHSIHVGRTIVYAGIGRVLHALESFASQGDNA
jgi:hypothetical protein